MSVMSAAVAECEDPSSPVTALVEEISSALSGFLSERTGLLRDISPDLDMLAGAARAAVLDGGKRLRPTFAYWGWRCEQPAGAADEPALIRAAASLELLHACALVHDDVMDSSDTRRGQPAAHLRFERIHREQGWPGSAESFGRSGAILLGDVLLSWAEEMFTAAIGRLPQQRARAAMGQFDLMRTEVVAGQFLDVLAQTRGAFDPDEALRVIEFKTSKYTVQRPLLLGAAAAGGSPELATVLSDYGLRIGEAFQLRDDLLGVFGDPAQTGKPAGDDLREGKRTLLVALAFGAADPGERALLREGIGNPALTEHAVAELREVLRRTGARDRIELRIAERATEAARCLAGAPLQPDAGRALLELADAAAHRTF